jgi:hypothetical protein
MGYEHHDAYGKVSRSVMWITKISASWDTNYHDGYEDKEEMVRASPANRDTRIAAKLYSHSHPGEPRTGIINNLQL